MTETESRRLTIRQTVICAVIAVLIAVIGMILSGKGITKYISPDSDVSSADALTAEWDGVPMRMDDPAVFFDPKTQTSYFKVHLTPEQAGSHELHLRDTGGEVVGICVLRSNRFSQVYDLGDGSFTGCAAVTAAMVFFLLSEAAVCFFAYRRAKGVQMYSYRPMLALGLSVFLLTAGIRFLFGLTGLLRAPHSYLMFNVYDVAKHTSSMFVALTSPAVLFFSIALIVSNVQLIRHEGARFRNSLGLLTGALMIGGMLFCSEPSADSFSVHDIILSLPYSEPDRSKQKH